jgi:hypothetical protein
MVKAGKMVPAEQDREIALAETLSGEQLDKHLELTRKVYEERGLKMFGERTPNNDKRMPGKPSRTEQMRAMAEQSADPEDKRRNLAACDLMDADEKLTLDEAIRKVYAEENKA